jgi:hypothetical protein
MSLIASFYVSCPTLAAFVRMSGDGGEQEMRRPGGQEKPRVETLVSR